MALAEDYSVPVSINNISDRPLELERQDTWNEAARQIQDRSSFHPEHQIIQIIRFQVSHHDFNKARHAVYRHSIIYFILFFLVFQFEIPNGSS